MIFTKQYMTVKKIFIFTTEPFPIGMAATNRIISYAKGFIFHGKSTEVICVRRSEVHGKKGYNSEVDGLYQGIKFKYLTKSTIKSDYFLLRRVHNFQILFHLFFYSFKHINKEVASIYYGNKMTLALILWLTNKIKRGVLLKDISEHPQTMGVNNLKKYFFNKYFFKLFDGYLIITKNLISYFNSITNKPILHVPMTVELDRFNYRLNNNKGNNIIIYTGVLDNNKDGIDILLEAFAGIVENNPYQLHLYGIAQSEKKIEEYFELVKRLKISHLVHFKGRVSREVITEKLFNAKILVLPRPDSIQAQHGFPTKLGEYLATTKPTLVTSVGEIPDYLTDNLDSYIAKPGDVLSLKVKLLEIIEDYPKAKKVGIRGRKIAETHFNNKIQTKKILDFIDDYF